MAEDINDPFKKEKKADDAAPAGGPVSISGTPVDSTAPGATAPVGAGSTPKGTSSGRFTNLQSYLKANAPQAGQAGLGGQIAGKVQAQGQQVGGQIKQAGQQFQEAQKAALPDQQQVSTSLEQLKTDPTKLNVSQFGQLRDVQYQGPQSLQGESRLQSGVQGLQDTSKLAGSEAGRFQLLRQMFSKPQYSTGQQGLDVALLQGSPEQLKQLSGTARTAAQTSKQLQAAQSQAQGAVQEGLGQAQQTRDIIRGAVESAATGLGSELAKQTDINLPGSAAWRRDQEQKAIQANLMSGQLSQEQYDKLLGHGGISADEKLYGISDLSKYFRPETERATTQNVMTPEQLARMQALGKLAGTTGKEASALYSQFGGLKESDVGSFGKAGTVDVNQLRTDIEAQKALYQQELSPAQLEAQQAQAALGGDLYSGKYYGTGSLQDQLRNIQKDIDIYGTNPVYSSEGREEMNLGPIYNQIQQQIQFEQNKLAAAQQRQDALAKKYGGQFNILKPQQPQPGQLLKPLSSGGYGAER